jgi:diguanylate cyclase (GGDEF)-like protein
VSDVSILPLRRLVSGIGTFVAIVTALSVPLGFGLMSAAYEADRLSFSAGLNASRVSRYIYQYGDLWPFHRVRLAELIELPENNHDTIRQRIFTSDGKLVLEEGSELPSPILSRSAPIKVGEATVGTMEVLASARPFLMHTLLVGLLSFGLAAIALFAVRFLPLKVLDRTMARLSDRERQLSEKNAQLDGALSSMVQGLCLFDAKDHLVVANQRFCDIFGVPVQQISTGMTLKQLLDLLSSTGNLNREDAERALTGALELVSRNRRASYTRELRDGRTFAVNFEPTRDGGWLVTYEELTERRRTESQIAHMAHHDALTGLPNRVRLRDVMQEALSKSDRRGPIGVLCLDLDYFKPVNDTLGHPVGDGLLKEVADRIRSSLRAGESFAARLGGDEFAVLQVGVEQPVASTELAARLIALISQPYDVDSHRIVIGTSVGIAVGPEDGDNPDQLLKNADLALYRAKQDGRGRSRFFEPEMDQKMQARRAMELDLRKALVLGEFHVMYQPLINLEKNKVSGFEALLRWDHPTRGRVPPSEFIPLAEEIGQISAIGRWVLQRACAEAATWPNDIKVAVNLSPAQFKDSTIMLDVVTALSASGLSPNRLELEITEGVLLQNIEGTMAILDQLRALGVHISMDDFGTGYSSLSYLRKFPFDKIKIDRSFINELADTADSLAIVRAVTGLGSSLGMSTTAEGVETLDQLRQIRAEGCTEAQGYLFSAAKPASELGELIQRLDLSLRRAA